eukprot:TRINITY_DN7853_c0_g1_i1.p1 TRINITY_DN7853_c0_g1~~TRINITY_DN7853_c0_g1_i1.p1  ORF type:complete len:209 (-),score=54.18 TRINITY_DN7853_c0_g1_i1:20-646(-)
MLSVQSNIFGKASGGGAMSARMAAADQAKRKFAVTEGDHLTLLNIYNNFSKISKERQSQWCQQNQINYKILMRADQIRNQISKYAKRYNLLNSSSSSPSTEAIRKSIVAGYFAHAASYELDGLYHTVRGDLKLTIHPSSVCYVKDPPKWVVYHEVVFTNKEYIRNLTAIEPHWLAEVAPHFYQFRGLNVPDSSDVGKSEQKTKQPRFG